MPEISVIIPTLGRPTLERAVASLGRQTMVPTEVIVVENGTEEIGAERHSALSSLAPRIPIRLVSLPPFSGPAVARNVGAWHATTPNLAFLDDDDEFTPSYLAEMAVVLAAGEAEVLYGTRVWRSADGSVLRVRRLGDIPADLWFDRLYRNENPGVGGQNLVVCRRRFFELGGFPTDLRSGEDRGFAMIALRSGARVTHVDAEVTCHDPEGYRASTRRDKWLTNVKIITDHWSQVGWASRGRAVWRWGRLVARR